MPVWLRAIAAIIGVGGGTAAILYGSYQQGEKTFDQALVGVGIFYVTASILMFWLTWVFKEMSD